MSTELQVLWCVRRFGELQGAAIAKLGPNMGGVPVVEPRTWWPRAAGQILSIERAFNILLAPFLAPYIDLTWCESYVSSTHVWQHSSTVADLRSPQGRYVAKCCYSICISDSSTSSVGTARRARPGH